MPKEDTKKAKNGHSRRERWLRLTDAWCGDRRGVESPLWAVRSCDFEASDVLLLLLLRPLRTFLHRVLGELPRWLVGAVRLTTDIIELPLQAITGLSDER